MRVWRTDRNLFLSLVFRPCGREQGDEGRRVIEMAGWVVFSALPEKTAVSIRCPCGQRRPHGAVLRPTDEKRTPGKRHVGMDRSTASRAWDTERGVPQERLCGYRLRQIGRC